VHCETSSRVLYRTSILLDSDIVLHHTISQHDEAQTRTHIPLQPLLTTRLPILLTPVVQSNIMSKKTNTTATKKRTSKELSNTKCRTTAKKKKKKRKALFVVKLFQFLMADDQHVDIVSWYKNCFVVWDRNLFEANVLPVLFSHNQYASFDRQTNFYNFAKMSIHDEFPTHKRIGKKDPIKYKHRMFYKGASLQQIQSIERSTSPHQLQELQETLECVNAQNSGIVGAMKRVSRKNCQHTTSVEPISSPPHSRAGNIQHCCGSCTEQRRAGKFGRMGSTRGNTRIAGNRDNVCRHTCSNFRI
jgi:hypothetical protein